MISISLDTEIFILEDTNMAYSLKKISEFESGIVDADTLFLAENDGSAYKLTARQMKELALQDFLPVDWKQVVYDDDASSFMLVEFGNDLYVAMKTNDLFLSKNGMVYDWYGGHFADPYKMYQMGLAFGKGKFVCAVLDGNEQSMKCNAMHSVNGLDWTIDNSIGLFAASVKFVNNKFVAVGLQDSMTNQPKFAYSDEGDTWTSKNLPITGTAFDVAYGNGYYVAVGGSGTENKNAAYSADGESWLLVSDTKCGNAVLQSATFGNGKFVAVGSNGKIIFSEDAQNWTAATVSEISVGVNVLKVEFGNGKFVAVCSDGKVFYSLDAERWFVVSGFEIEQVKCLKYANGKFIVSNGTNKKFYCVA